MFGGVGAGAQPNGSGLPAVVEELARADQHWSQGEGGGPAGFRVSRFPHRAQLDPGLVFGG